MSTILKALQRLEDEKRVDPELTLDEQVAIGRVPQSPQPRSSLVLVGSGVAAIVVAVGAIYFWIGSDSATEVKPTTHAAAAPSGSAAAPPVAPSPIRRTPPRLARSKPVAASTGAGTSPAPDAGPAATDVSTPAASRVEVVEWLSPPSKAETERSLPLGSRKDLAARERSTGAALSAAVSDSETQVVASARNTEARRPPTRPAASPTRSASPSRVEPAGDSEAIARLRKSSKRARMASPVSKPVSKPTATASEPTRAKQPLASRVERAQPPPAPAPPALSKSPATGSGAGPDHQVVVRANLPELRVRSTVWHPQKSRRIAMVEINAGEVVTLNEGDAVGPLVVESIKPTGVSFMHDGVSVLHKVGR